MSAKITVGKLEITVATAELGEALRQLEPWLNPPAPAISPVPQSSPAPSWEPALSPILKPLQPPVHALAPAPGLNASSDWPFPTGASSRGKSKALFELASGADEDDPQPSASSDSADTQLWERALTLLKGLRDHRKSGGLNPQEVMRIVGASHPKGTGSRMQGINRVFVTFGFKPEAVYSNARGTLGDRVWLPKQRTEEAIAVLETALNNK